MRAAAGCLLLMLASAPGAAADWKARATVEAAAQQAGQQIAQADEAALVQALVAALHRAPADALGGEALLQAALLRLRELPAPQASTRQRVASLLDYPSRTLTEAIDPEQARAGPVPAFRIAATARGTLRRWDEQRDAARLARTPAGLRPELDEARLRAVLPGYLRGASPGELDRLDPTVLPADAAVLAAWFARRPDAAVLRRLLALPAQAEGHTALAAAPRVLPATEAAAVLLEAARQSGYRSAARLALAPLAVDDARVRQYLLDSLGDADGASSAQALARVADDATLGALHTLVAASGDGPAQRRALLALRGMDRADARALLARVAVDPRYPAELRNEVQAWLR